MLIHVPAQRQRFAGFWARDRTTGELRHVDAHPEGGAVLYSAWPASIDGDHASAIERAIDEILNADAASQDRVDGVFRRVTAWSRRQACAPLQSAFWRRSLVGLSGGDFSVYAGHDQTAGARSFAGLVIPTADTSIDVDGFVGTTSQERGAGPGGAASGGNAGHGTAGSGDRAGPAVPAGFSFAALETGMFDAEHLAMGGAAGSRGSNRGRSGGDGNVRIAPGPIVDTSDYTLHGRQVGRGPYAGSGSGGGLYRIGLAGYEQRSGADFDLGRSSGDSVNGQGRLTLWIADAATFNGSRTGVATTVYQVYPSPPLGGLRVTS